ncbi:MAG: SpoIID/LytB domain-containing protein [Lachnospiraceae bacterium]|nr:SpoIID/LytB domain-containing protein [Lachnospiraceae bacterium]
MSAKKKLILIGICIGIIVAVFTVNVVRRMKDGNEGDKDGLVVKENVIRKAEAYRLLSFLAYDKSERESLSFGITYADENMSDWYDSYVNAVWKMGLIEGSVSASPKETLTYGECKSLIDQLILKYPRYQNIYEGLSFGFVKADDKIALTEFLELFEALLSVHPEEERRVKDKLLFVLGNEEVDNGSGRMVTDQGKYYYQNAKNYENQYKMLQPEQQEQLEKSSTNQSELSAAEQEAVRKENEKADQKKEQEDAELVEPEGSSTADGNTADSVEAGIFGSQDIARLYLDKGIHAKVCGSEILYLTSVTTEKIVIRNVWIEQGEGKKVNAFVNGLKKSFEGKFPLSDEIKNVVGDITVEDQKVVQISVKPDIIEGKVLQSGKDFIEVEGYGKIPLDQDYKIYKIYGELSMESTNSILVGYNATDFVVSGGKISAALIKESIKAENIRVLIKTTDYTSYYHNEIMLTSEEEFTVQGKKNKKTYAAGETVTITPNYELLSEGRIKIEAATEEGKIQILSIKRLGGNPKYRGTIEIAKDANGLLLVNELPLEEYLYAVIPSEMPTYYGMEPLKVQAVCARSYAYRHLLANSLNQYGAHVDDSVSYQVYNNISENEDSILAVKDTYGQVIKYDGEVITAYYFSTSCGHTTMPEYVWANGQPIPYLKGKLMAVEDSKEVSVQDSIRLYKDLSKEENFRKFINDKDVETYDSEFDWYRWNTTINIEDIQKNIEEKLPSRYQANSNLVLTMVTPAEDGKEAVFESIPVDSIGEIVDISVKKREAGGIITELLVTGSKKTVVVKTEYNIRLILAPTNSKIVRKDLSEVNGLSLLPSAFFIIDKTVEDGKLKNITLTGGGYGHGVGMSQNGVKAMADHGQSYETIVSYFYEGTKLGFIYE